jgi:acetyltransferase-like isoleucine patch superfamily enzyme
MVSWGTVITDSWVKNPNGRKEALLAMLKNPNTLQRMEYSAPVVLKDNVWVGFGCVIMPGVTIGEGAIVGSNTVVYKDVEPYTVVAGSPARVIKKLLI